MKLFVSSKTLTMRIKNIAVRNIAIMVMSFFLNACVNHTAMEVTNNVAYQPNWHHEKAVQDPVITQWWSVFNDPLLESLIEQASVTNYQVRIAQSNIYEARALRGIASANQNPHFSVNSQQQRYREITPDQVDNRYLLDLDASWEVDIFGSNRAKVAVANAGVAASIFQKRDTMMLVMAEVAHNYIQLRGNQRRLAIIERNVALQDETLQLVTGRVNIGLSRALDKTRAEAQLQQTKALIPSIKADIHNTIYRLSVLSGQAPEHLFSTLSIHQALPLEPDIVPLGLRSELLQRRPDVRSAEIKVQQQLAELSVAKAELYPKFSLTGLANLQANSLGDLLKKNAATWTVASVLQWPIFRGGALRANIQAQEAKAEKALLTYEQQILTAFEDVEKHLNLYSAALATRIRLQQAVSAAQQSVTLANGLYTQGLSNFIDVLDADSRLSEVEDALVQSETKTLLHLIGLYKALGGGWEVPNS